MIVKDLAQIFKPITMTNGDDKISTAYTGDLLSDVIGNVDDESVLITVQAHKNTIAVCSLSSMPAIIICNNRSCPDDMIEAAIENNISIFATKDNQFMASVKIAKLLEL